MNRTLKTFLKYELQADKITLCAFNNCPSQDNVTSTKSSSFLKESNSDTMFI